MKAEARGFSGGCRGRGDAAVVAGAAPAGPRCCSAGAGVPGSNPRWAPGPTAGRAGGRCPHGGAAVVPVLPVPVR